MSNSANSNYHIKLTCQEELLHMFYAFANPTNRPEALCFRVVRPSVCAYVRPGGGILRPD